MRTPARRGVADRMSLLVENAPNSLRSPLEGASWLLLLGTTTFIVATATASSDIPLAAVFGAAALGTAAFRGTASHLVRLSFAFNVIWVYLLAAHFTDLTGSPFTPGRDDELFHETSVYIGRLWADGNWAAHAQFSNYSGYGYIIVGAALYALLSPLGEYGPLLIRLLGALIGATIPAAVYFLARTLLPEKGERYWTITALATGLFPIVTYYSALGLRDIWLAAAAIWLVAAVVRAEGQRSGPAHSWILPVVILAIVGVFRPQSLIALVSLWLGVLYARRGTAAARVTSLLLLAGTAAFLLVFFEALVMEMATQQLRYEFALDEAQEGSLGVRILQIPPPAGWIARFAYAAVAPVPPFPVLRLDTLLFGIGATAWYFVLPLATGGWISLRRRGPQQKAIAQGIAVFTIVLLVGVALTSIDPRHKLPLIPVAVLLTAVAVADRTRRWIVDRLIAIAMAGAALFAAYLVLKLW